MKDILIDKFNPSFTTCNDFLDGHYIMRFLYEIQVLLALIIWVKSEHEPYVVNESWDNFANALAKFEKMRFNNLLYITFKSISIRINDELWMTQTCGKISMMRIKI